MTVRIRSGFVALLITWLSLLSIVGRASAQDSTQSNGVRWIEYTQPDGDSIYLEDNRKPALYTGNFGDCSGNSQINVSRFDAAYYQDNMTVIFHIAGASNLYNQSLMMYIGVFAYGESRFDLVFNPCQANIASLCPVNSSIPIAAQGIIPVAPSDVANIPAIALTIPDFEGEAVLRIFSNVTESQIACYSAVVTNGNSFSQPESVGSVLGIFTFVALLASFATAIYGESIPTMRLHYAHSLSVGVVFAVFQHIFFSGTLSLNWPAVLPAWWSNFAWAGGMIYTSSMQASIDNLIGNVIGNTTQVGAAESGTDQGTSFGGGNALSEIYGRALRPLVQRAANHPILRDIASEIYSADSMRVRKRDALQHTVERTLAHRLQARDFIANSSTGFNWYGHPVYAGLPLPGNYSGFAGTLSAENIRVSNAFMTGLLWFLILFVAIVGSVVLFKWFLEALIAIRLLRKERLRFFRAHWLTFTGLAALRTCFIAFFMMMLLTMFQFSFHSNGAVKGIAAIFFVIFLLGMAGAAFYAIQYQRLRARKTSSGEKERKKILGVIPWTSTRRSEVPAVVAVTEAEPEVSERIPMGKRPSFWKRLSSGAKLEVSEVNNNSVHDDEEYIAKYGWLAARFRRTRWWFFAAWLFYDFLRAIFYGGATDAPLAQLFGLLVIEVLAAGFIIWARPFEGQRLNLLVVYALSVSKIATIGLSIAFDNRFGVGRIITTAIGIVIIVIQGILTILTMIAIVAGAVTSYLSVSRNRDNDDFRPRKWLNMREKYFDHLDRVVNDLPKPPKPVKAPKPPPPPEPVPGFEMKTVRRLNKIEDDDVDFTEEMRLDGTAIADSSFVGATNDNRSRAPASPVHGATGRSRTHSRAPSVTSVRSNSSLPYGARAHRPSWSTRDFADRDMGTAEYTISPVDLSRTVSDDLPASPPSPMGKRNPKRSSTVSPVADEPIGGVPMPTTRPRAGTLSSMHSRKSMGAAGDYSGEAGDARPGSRRSSWGPVAGPSSAAGPSQNPAYGSTTSRTGGGAMNPLTPAQEMEEWLEAPRKTRL